MKDVSIFLLMNGLYFNVFKLNKYQAYLE